MTPNRERTYEAIYAAAFVREYSALSAPFGPMPREDRFTTAHQRAEDLAETWLSMVLKAEGEQG